MTSLILIILVFIVGIAIIYGYYLDYKSDPKGFSKGFKKAHQVAKWLGLVLLIIMVFDLISKNIFPLKNNYGFEHNNFRFEAGIPLIEPNWRKEPSWGNQYRTWYVAPKKDSLAVHSKKKIEFDIWGAVSETDYFASEIKSIIVISHYSYETNKTRYYNANKFGEKSNELTKTEFENVVLEMLDLK